MIGAHIKQQDDPHTFRSVDLLCASLHSEDHQRSRQRYRQQILERQLLARASNCKTDIQEQYQAVICICGGRNQLPCFRSRHKQNSLPAESHCFLLFCGPVAERFGEPLKLGRHIYLSSNLIAPCPSLAEFLSHKLHTS